MKRFIFRLFGIKEFTLNGTWHVCKHEFEVHKVGENVDTELLCTKCRVSARVMGSQRVILVNAETNHPFLMQPWQIDKENCEGININR